MTPSREIAGGSDTDREELIVRCAWLYHDDRLTQEQIAERFNISRSTVSRALSEAERRGIVRVVITEPLPEALRLENELAKRFGIAAVVGISNEGESSRSVAGRAAARTLETLVLQDDITIAMGWGRTLAAMLPYLRPRKTRRVAIIGSIGHSLASESAPSATVVREIAATFSAEVEWVPAPLYSIGSEVTRALVNNIAVRSVLDRARQADVIFTSIGCAEMSNPLVAKGMLTPAAMQEMLARGAVGDILANFIDADGSEVRLEEFEPVGLRLDDVRQASRVVAVASGPERVPAIRAALSGGYLSELVLDDLTAEALLRSD
ncbi:MAG: sugar-binding transcriptional regulator [Acidimicrobiales bacterium]